MSCQLGVGWGFGSGVQRSPGQLWKDRAGFVQFHRGCVVGGVDRSVWFFGDANKLRNTSAESV